MDMVTVSFTCAAMPMRSFFLEIVSYHKVGWKHFYSLSFFPFTMRNLLIPKFY